MGWRKVLSANSCLTGVVLNLQRPLVAWLACFSTEQRARPRLDSHVTRFSQRTHVRPTPNKQGYTEKVDIFSMGIIFLQLLALRSMPFEGHHRHEVFDLVTEGQRPFVDHSWDPGYAQVRKRGVLYRDRDVYC